jgi:hypothetical protein
MTEKAKNDLTSELMRRYNIKTDDDEVDAAPKPISEANASDPLYSSPPPPRQEEALVNPLLKIQEEEASKKEAEPTQNVLQRNEGLAEVGAVLGGAAQYKGVGQNLLRPVSSLFSPDSVDTVGGRSGAMPPAMQPMSDVEHTMQSGQGQRPGETGRARENTHNQETNRQALATKQGLQLPGAERVLVDAGPMYTTSSGVAIPKSAAAKMEEDLKARQALDQEQRRQILERQAIEQRRIDQRKANVAKAIGSLQGTGRVAQGVIGGGLAAPQLYEYGRDVVRNDKSKPADSTQGLSGAGGLMMAFGKGKAGGLGALAQVPYIVKNRKELAASMGMGDINPTAFMGMPDEMDPAFPQLRPR